MSVKTILAAGSALMVLLFNCTGAGAGGVLLYDNLSSPVTGFDPTGPLYASFSNSSTARTLTEIDLNIFPMNPLDNGQFSVSVYADNSTHPGALLWSTTMNDSILSATPTVEDFLTTLSLNADSRYWVGLDATIPGALGLSSATITSGIGVANEFYINTANILEPNSAGPYVMRVVGTPEPGTWAMMLLGFAGLGFVGYRRARAAHDLT